MLINAYSKRKFMSPKRDLTHTLSVCMMCIYRMLQPFDFSYTIYRLAKKKRDASVVRGMVKCSHILRITHTHAHDTQCINKCIICNACTKIERWFLGLRTNRIVSAISYQNYITCRIFQAILLRESKKF